MAKPTLTASSGRCWVIAGDLSRDTVMSVRAVWLQQCAAWQEPVAVSLAAAQCDSAGLALLCEMLRTSLPQGMTLLAIPDHIMALIHVHDMYDVFRLEGRDASRHS